MEDIKKQLGLARGLLENAGTIAEMKKSFTAILDAMDLLADELGNLKEDNEELNEYVSRIDEDLGELEMMHDDEDYFDGGYDPEDFPEGDDEPEDGETDGDTDTDGPEDNPDDNGGAQPGKPLKIWKGSGKKKR